MLTRDRRASPLFLLDPTRNQIVFLVKIVEPSKVQILSYSQNGRVLFTHATHILVTESQVTVQVLRIIYFHFESHDF